VCSSDLCSRLERRYTSLGLPRSRRRRVLILPVMTASAAASNCASEDPLSAILRMCLMKVDQVGNPCERAMTNCARDSLLPSDNFSCAKAATSWIQLSILTGSRGVISMPDRLANPSTQFLDHLRMASESLDLAARSNSLESFLY